MSITVTERLDKLRLIIKREGISAFIVPSSDVHFSEYVSDYYKCREFLSGFSGSAGTLVVTLDEASLWSDSRYFIQAESQLLGTGIKLKKQGLESTPSIEEWLKGKLHKGDIIGLNGFVFSIEDVSSYQKWLPDYKIISVGDIVSLVWTNRPELKHYPITVMSEQIAGASVRDKMKTLRDKLQLSSNAAYILTSLDSIAWLFNIRGNDIDFNMVAFAYAIIERERATIFLDKDNLTESSKEYFISIGVEVLEYDSFDTYITKLTSSDIIYNSKTLSYNHYNTLLEHGYRLIREDSCFGVVNILKGIKNSVEIDGFRQCMIDDGVALTKFYKWLEESLDNGVVHSEMSLRDKLYTFRANNKNFVQESFSTIIGYKSNGAIVHYSVTNESSKAVDKGGFLLIDSGAHYIYGTTDITRTIHTGDPTPEQKADFTKVLIGNIDLSTTIFPVGTVGSQLDIIARRELLLDSLNYMHGTGHGVGHSLNVHEGAFSIRKEYNPIPLSSGMITSNEPGLYRKGLWGIRIENMMLIKDHAKNEYGNFLSFETLSLCFIDTKCIDISMLERRHKQYLNSYHAMVYNRLSPFLDHKEKTYLALKCKEIK